MYLWVNIAIIFISSHCTYHTCTKKTKLSSQIFDSKKWILNMNYYRLFFLTLKGAIHVSHYHLTNSTIQRSMFGNLAVQQQFLHFSIWWLYNLFLHNGVVSIAVDAWYCGLLECSLWPSASDFSTQGFSQLPHGPWHDWKKLKLPLSSLCGRPTCFLTQQGSTTRLWNTGDSEK